MGQRKSYYKIMTLKKRSIHYNVDILTDIYIIMTDFFLTLKLINFRVCCWRFLFFFGLIDLLLYPQVAVKHISFERQPPLT